MTGVDPKFIFWFGVWTNILTLIAGYGFEHAPPLVAQYAPTVQWVAGFLTQANSLVLTALIGVSGKGVGPLVAVPTSAVKPIVIVAIIMATLFSASDARAQGGIKVKLPQVTGDFVGDAKANLGIGTTNASAAPALTGKIEKDAQAIWKRIQSLTKADLNYAIAKAKAANTNAATIRLQCLQAISDANDQANGASLKNPDGTDMVRPDPALVTGIEDVAELVDNLSPQGKLFTSCAGAAQMFKTNTLAVISAIVTGAAGIAALPAGL